MNSFWWGMEGRHAASLFVQSHISHSSFLSWSCLEGIACWWLMTLDAAVVFCHAFPLRLPPPPPFPSPLSPPYFVVLWVGLPTVLRLHHSNQDPMWRPSKRVLLSWCVEHNQTSLKDTTDMEFCDDGCTKEREDVDKKVRNKAHKYQQNAAIRGGLHRHLRWVWWLDWRVEPSPKLSKAMNPTLKSLWAHPKSGFAYLVESYITDISKFVHVIYVWTSFDVIRFFFF